MTERSSRARLQQPRQRHDKPAGAHLQAEESEEERAELAPHLSSEESHLPAQETKPLVHLGLKVRPQRSNLESQLPAELVDLDPGRHRGMIEIPFGSDVGLPDGRQVLHQRGGFAGAEHLGEALMQVVPALVTDRHGSP